MPLFQNSVLKKYLKSQHTEELKEKWALFKAYFHNSTIQENIRNLKEEEFQEGFVRELFVEVLGYTLNPNPNYNFVLEKKNVKDSKKADGAIILNNNVKAVIELKGTDTTDLGKVESQAFNYKNNQPECVYVITSNFEKLRFYIENAIEHLEFNLFNLTEEEFHLLYVCLAYKNIESNVAKHIKDESVSQEDVITKKLYNDYSLFKRELYQNLVKLNPGYDSLELFKKSQKLLDRFLFIFFAEDRSLLPTNLIFRINKEWQQLREMRIEVSLYDRYKVYFNDLNHGARVSLPAFSQTAAAKKEEYQIYAYNGGLFKDDEILSAVKIDDDVLFKHTEKLSNYDFASEVDVNILGHIFENSLNELDEIKAQLEGQEVEKTKTKRKKDGVFYTPKYITKYIVDNTVGKLCLDKKAELQLNDEDYIIDKKRQHKTKQALTDKLNTYRNWLLQLTICDPACGSGAFLNQALDFLIAEHRYIDELQAKLFGDTLVLSDVEGSILENNLFGVDINEESVEIAKLSLWLRTAQPNRKLNDLNSNIKCGNSLIDDVSVAGDKAFNWRNEFLNVFERGGFDVIIGNPPYVSKTFTDKVKAFYKSKYKTAQYQLELYVLFMELAVLMTKRLGKLSFIVPNSWMKNLMFGDCRQYLLQNVSFDIIVPNLDKVFSDASVDTCIFISTNEQVSRQINIGFFKTSDFVFKHLIDQNRLLQNEKFIFDVEISGKSESIFKKIESLSIKLEEISDVTRGINPYDKYRGQSEEIIKTQAYHANYKKDSSFVPELRGRHINRYIYNWDNISYVSYGDWLAAPREKKYFEGERILCRQVLSTHLNCCLITEDFIIDQSVFIAKITKEYASIYNAKYVLALFASKLLSYYFRNKANEFDALFPKIKIGEFKNLPICKSSLEKQKPLIDKSDLMIQLTRELQLTVDKFIEYNLAKYNIEKASNKLQEWFNLEFSEFIKELNKDIKSSKVTLLTKKDEFDWMELFNDNKRKALELKSKIDKVDKEIDQMVYKLYDLTEEEIKIVEGVI